MAYSFFPNDFHNLPNLQDNATMNYLTQHYKNLSEQLQTKVNHLHQLLEKAKETEDVIIDDAERDEGEYHPTLQGRLAKGKGKKRGRQVDVEPGRAIVGVSKETEITHAHELADDDADKNNIYRTGRPLKVYKSEMRRVVEESKPKGMKLSIIDRVSGSAYNQTGEGARFIAQGEDGKHYTFNSAAQWAWDNEDPGEAPKTFEVDSANPDHEIRDVMPVDWNNKHDAREFRTYHPDFKG
jgi:hypothetical protein